MSAAKEMVDAGDGAIAGNAVDRIIDRILGWACADEAASDGARLLAFQRILLLHLAVRFATGSCIREVVPDPQHYALAGVLAGRFALSWARRFVPLAVAGAFAAMLALLAFTFPQTSNHFYLELWCLALVLVVETDRRESRIVLLAALRWSIAIFYTGLQKMLYGRYFQAQHLAFEVATRPEFAQVFQWMMPAAELGRLE